MNNIVKLLSIAAIMVGVSAVTHAEDGQKKGILNKITNIAPAAGNPAGFEMDGITAKPGECYGKVTTPAQTRTEAKRVEIAPASKQIAKIIPATYKTVTEEVVIQEASEDYTTIPATYKTVTEQVIVKPATKKIVKVPAKYDMVSERIQVSPAQTVWKKGNSSPITRTNDRGEVMCLVEVPAKYKTIEKRVLVSPETTREETVAAVTKTITRKVVDKPAGVRKIQKPAVKKMVSKQVLDQPEQIVYKETPAKFDTVTREVVVAAATSKWDKILCQTNATTTNVKALQRALVSKGYKPGPIDGVLGYGTYAAVDKFQRAKGFNRGEITYETLAALGLNM